MSEKPYPILFDIDSMETHEWLSALVSVLRTDGVHRGQFLLEQLSQQLKAAGLPTVAGINTTYRNTIPVAQQAPMPDEGEVAIKASALIRWHAIAMVIAAGKQSSELGGHIATYASAAVLYDVGFNHFFRTRHDKHPGDLVYFQGHASPGMYARAYVEGRFDKQRLTNFRQEVLQEGLSSYPHPWLMPDFWQFPTVSMGLGPLMSIYQARFLNYLQHRGLVDNQDRQIWVYCGDGEMDEPESLGAITLAGREKLDNLNFVINCNLQRLDGPVRGNGKIVQELEAVFHGAGWNVLKVLWNSAWDELFARDTHGVLAGHLGACVDGELQNLDMQGPAFWRENFFGRDPYLAALVADWSDDKLATLGRGGHDAAKVYAAYSAAQQHKGQPTVILVQTLKGYGLGPVAEGTNSTHQQKKLNPDELQAIAARFDVPLSAKKAGESAFCDITDDMPERQYLLQKREALGGSFPQRQTQAESLPTPELNEFAPLLEGSGGREISTTMAYVRILNILLKNRGISKNIVPVVPDESRTFGMEGLFRQIGIYSRAGQLYDPVDKKQVMYYKEAQDGQLLQEGINEAGAMCSWLAAATSYSTNGLPMVPFYIYYSMFGYQRTGDLMWLAGDMRARGFILGATAGRTTLAGEGLQHQDGHSHVLMNTIPNCVCYDPTYGYELAVIMRHGWQRMATDQEDVFFYITLMNENYHHPAMPEGAEQGIIKGMYRLTAGAEKARQRVQLLGSGTILCEVEAAAKLLAEDYQIAADVWSVTSFTELRREALAVERHNQLHPEATPTVPYVTQCLQTAEGPVIAASDYVRLHADQIRAFVPTDYHVLGTDGFGRSGTRAQLREFFEVTARHVAYRAMYALWQQGEIEVTVLQDAKMRYGIDSARVDPVGV